MTDHNPDGLTFTAARARHINDGDALECARCAALIANDRAALHRHLDWHQQRRDPVEQQP